MKIEEIINEDKEGDFEKALAVYAKKKQRDQELLTKGSAAQKGFWKGKRAANTLTNNPVTRGIQQVHQWVRKQSK